MAGEVKCRICGRPFVDFEAHARHEIRCVADRQAELDRKWEEGQRKRKMKQGGSDDGR